MEYYSNLLSLFAEYEEHGIDDIRFSTAVRANNARESLMKRSNFLNSGVRFKVLQDHLGNQHHDVAHRDTGAQL